MEQAAESHQLQEMTPSKSPEPSDTAESSGQALERYIVEQLSSLSLSAPQDDVGNLWAFDLCVRFAAADNMIL